MVEKFDLDTTPVLSSPSPATASLRELTEIATKQVKEPLERLPGVGSIEIVGGQEREVQVDVDADKLDAYGLTIQQVGAALRRRTSRSRRPRRPGQPRRCCAPSAASTGAGLRSSSSATRRARR